MQYYHPDKFIILKIQSSESIIYKVLAGWNGWHLTKDSWRLNSGIESVRITEFPAYREYEFYGYSGSVYNCADITEGWTVLTKGIYDSSCKTQIENDLTIENISLIDFLKEFEGEIHYV